MCELLLLILLIFWLCCRPKQKSKEKVEPPQPEPQLDDLEKIEGIGPKIAELLDNAGIKTFAQLAAADVDRLKQILDKGGRRFQMANPSTWPEQARLAAQGKWEELADLQNDLQGGRRKPA